MYPDVPTATAELHSEFSSLWLRIDTQTGLPIALGSHASPAAVSARGRVSIVVGGRERRGSHGDLVYEGSLEVHEISATGVMSSHLIHDGRVFVIPITVGGWKGEMLFTFRRAEPSLTWALRLRPTVGAESIRELIFGIDLELPDAESWIVNAPGNRIRRDLTLSDLPSATPVQPMAGGGGSSGIVAFTDVRGPSTLVVWPRSKDEVGEITLGRTRGGAAVAYATGLSAAATSDTDLCINGIALDILPNGWPQVLDHVQNWFSDLNISTPEDRADWTRRATIYEVQIGTSLFAGGTWSYSPYPELADLYRDLPRISELGFDTIQLMPRQPFPSYNVIDYDDIETTYGNGRELLRVVDWCHSHGMRLILDVVMHGVIDKESIGEAAEAVRQGPWAELALAGATEVEAEGLDSLDQARLSWSRHILDFEKSWMDGSPLRHPLTMEHPEWFSTDSSGKISGVYTKAFDLSNPAWQRYFADAMVRLVERLGIDGFRFDAPGYNNFPNWSERTRSHASLQHTGAIQLFRHLRIRLHELNADLMLYTEDSGPLWRQSMDLNYNYDEIWLPESLFGPGGDARGSRVRNGRELSAWLSDRDRSLPSGSLTAHHIDSHDTFWWPLPTLKWRREQFGIGATSALMSAFALSGGPYMMFVGGEEGMEKMVRSVNAIRLSRPELFMGTHRHGLPLIDSADIYAVSHHSDNRRSIVLVNLSSGDIETVLHAAEEFAGEWLDLLADRERVVIDAGLPIGFAPFQARFLVPADE